MVSVSLFWRGRPEGKNESGIIDYILTIMRDMYGEDKIIYRFLKFLKRNKNEIFLYLNENEAEKTSDKTGQHFSVKPWLFENRCDLLSQFCREFPTLKVAGEISMGLNSPRPEVTLSFMLSHLTLRMQALMK